MMKVRSPRDGRKGGSIMSSGFTYDAVNILGFGEAATQALPQAAEDEVVLRYGGWSLQELRDSAIGQRLMHRQDWYDTYPWSTEKLPSGVYRLRVPVPESSGKTFADQKRMLPNGEQIAPIVLVASGLLVHYLQTGEDLLKKDWTRCREQTADGRVGLGWHCGRLDVNNDWDDYRDGSLWASSVRTS